MSDILAEAELKAQNYQKMVSSHIRSIRKYSISVGDRVVGLHNHYISMCRSTGTGTCSCCSGNPDKQLRQLLAKSAFNENVAAERAGEPSVFSGVQLLITYASKNNTHYHYDQFERIGTMFNNLLKRDNVWPPGSYRPDYINNCFLTLWEKADDWRYYLDESNEEDEGQDLINNKKIARGVIFWWENLKFLVPAFFNSPGMRIPNGRYKLMFMTMLAMFNKVHIHEVCKCVSIHSQEVLNRMGAHFSLALNGYQNIYLFGECSEGHFISSCLLSLMRRVGQEEPKDECPKARHKIANLDYKKSRLVCEFVKETKMDERVVSSFIEQSPFITKEVKLESSLDEFDHWHVMTGLGPAEEVNECERRFTKTFSMCMKDTSENTDVFHTRLMPLAWCVKNVVLVEGMGVVINESNSTTSQLFNGDWSYETIDNEVIAKKFKIILVKLERQKGDNTESKLLSVQQNFVVIKPR